MKNKKEVKCPKCKHIFKTRSKLILVTCNGCGNKFKKEEHLVRPKSQKRLEK